MVLPRKRRTTVMSTRRKMRRRYPSMGMLLYISIRLTLPNIKCFPIKSHFDFKNIAISGQVSAYENYVTSLKFKISFLNSRTGDKMLVYDHGYGKKYRYHDSWGWVRHGKKQSLLQILTRIFPGHLRYPCARGVHQR